MKIIFAYIILTSINTVQNTLIEQVAIGGNEGTFLEFPNGLQNVNTGYANRAYQNTQFDPSATNPIRTGNTVLTGENTNIDNSDVYILNIAQQNFAEGLPSTVSGVQSVFSGVKDSNLTLSQISNVNTANNFQQGTPRYVISGIQTEVQFLGGGSVLYADNTASINQAVIFEGVANGGINNTIGKSKNSQTVLENLASGNQAIVLGSGTSISGIQNNLQLSVNRENKPNNNETANKWRNYAFGNYATNLDGPAIAGIQNNIGIIKSSKNSNFTGLGLKLDDTAQYNRAISSGGDAIAGVQTNINKLKNTRADIDIDSQENYASTTQIGQSFQKYNSVAGADVNVNKIIGSDVDVTINSQRNIAINSEQYGDAIAGSDIDIGVLKNSNITFDVTTEDNTAISATGNAIAGSLIKIGRSRNSNIQNNSQITYSGNYANAPYGIAIDGAYYDLP